VHYQISTTWALINVLHESQNCFVLCFDIAWFDFEPIGEEEVFRDIYSFNILLAVWPDSVANELPLCVIVSGCASQDLPAVSLHRRYFTKLDIILERLISDIFGPWFRICCLRTALGLVCRFAFVLLRTVSLLSDVFLRDRPRCATRSALNLYVMLALFRRLTSCLSPNGNLANGGRWKRR
jgi:hypothetical protein